uniref:DNA/RNA-binding protein Kin17 WH-like domain-containing protein n=1 Tax=Acrobeloides nanus TaxID=290746 RepID=A0A914D2L0_9BILA
MGKTEKGTPKDLAKRMKSKGLQKLKWFCQMCQKQCRDQNGFKCHLTSESHQRQLLLFAENQNSYLREFSREFESNFMRILRHTFGAKRVRANDVYQDYIKEKGHVHMNSTVWHTLTGFVLYLGSSGKCKIDQNEKGWWIQYIDQEDEMRKQKLQDRAKKERDDEDRFNEMIQRQMEKDLEKLKEQDEKELAKPTDLIRNEDEKIAFAMATDKKVIKQEEDVKPLLSSSAFDAIKGEKKKDRGEKRPSTSKGESSSKKSALDEIMEQEEMFKERKNRKDFWLHKGVIVKIVTKKLGSDYYKAKGEIVDVIDSYTAKVQLDDGDILKLDQEHLETVIPAVGKDMLIVNGAYRGLKATLLELLENKFCVRLKIREGTRNGRVVEVAYEDASKLA